MCMIICKEIGVNLPTPEIIQNCAISNRDGIGIAWARDGKVYIKKDFESTEAFIEWLSSNITKDMPAMIHFRLATHGASDNGNRHPFPITNDPETMRLLEYSTDLAMTHNGILSDYKDKAGILSDTMVFVRDMLADKAIRDNLDSDTIRLLIRNHIGSYNKLAFLWADGHMEGIGDFKKDHGGLYFSNEGYKITRYERLIYNQDKTIPQDNDSIAHNYGLRKGRENCIYCYREFKRKKMVKVNSYQDAIDDYACKECFALENGYLQRYGA